tara:strand:+ start:2128 stop:2436 length:309 start_codon:yes stop_codon:yes gene_type:complete
MSIARINMLEWRSEEEFLEISDQFNKESAKTFPDAEILLRIKTTPTSVIAISVFPNQEKADEAKIQRDKNFEKYGAKVKDQWFLEGEVVQAYVKPQKFGQKK